MRIGIDLGGTKIEGLVLSGDGDEIARRRIATPRSYEGTLDAIARLVADIQLDAATSTPPPVGLGIPGALVRATGLVKNANSTWLNGQPLQRDIEARLGRPVRLSNDANCFTLSEATDGAGANARVVFGVILGTGVGGGVVVDGNVIDGPNLIAGEWGHNPLPWPDEHESRHAAQCYCGKRGCIETWLSGPGFQSHFTRDTTRTLSTHELVAAAADGDVDARAAMDQYVTRLAKSLATVVNILDPDVIVLGGGMSNLPELAESANAKVSAWTFSAASATRIVRNVHGDSSGVRGAAWLWPSM
jgi:fructokinase